MLPQTRKVLSKDCIEAVMDLQHALNSKQHKFAGYRRLYIKNYIDACTTSPVEGHNHVIKHGPDKVNRNLNLDVSLVRIMTSLQRRLEKRMKEDK